MTASGACETIGFTFFNREEASAVAQGSDFSPLPPQGAANSLCWESTIMSIRNPGAPHNPTDNTVSTVLGSKNLTNVNVTSGSQNGWGILTFTGPGATAGGLTSTATSQRVALGTTIAAPAVGAVTFYGLPVTGFMIRTFANGQLTCGTASCQGNYGAAFAHSYRTTILP
jgi:hypothetical protein